MTGAFVNGTPAVVIAVSMAPGLNVVSFADLLRGDVERLRNAAGRHAACPDHGSGRGCSTQLLRVAKVFLETLAIVMAVVVLFLGMRTGLIVSAIVPTTVLGTMAIMKILNIDLHMISVGAIIIALGLFVDNAIVVAEDMERRLSLGESPDQAAAHAGSTMFVPLLVLRWRSSSRSCRWPSPARNRRVSAQPRYRDGHRAAVVAGHRRYPDSAAVQVLCPSPCRTQPHRTRGRAADGLVPRQGPLDPGAQGHLHRRNGCTAGNLRLVVHHRPQRADAAVRAPSAADGHRAVSGFQPGQYDGGCSTDQQGTGRREARSGDLQPCPVHGRWWSTLHSGTESPYSCRTPRVCRAVTCEGRQA